MDFKESTLRAAPVVPGAGVPGADNDDNGAAVPDFRGKTCFVIMPYGEPGQERAHFDNVYELICDTVQKLGITPLRSDRRAEAVPIHSKMLTDIIDADLAIVDITNRNPNVFYELGVRHTARRNSTILLGHGDTKPPFNITGIRILSYDLSSDTKQQASMKTLRRAIVANLSSRATDSLVHALVPGLNLTRPDQALYTDCERVEVRLRLDNPKLANRKLVPVPETADGSANDPTGTVSLGVIKGDLVDVDTVDVLVNPESTRMDMARVYDNSVSAFVRYHGAEKDSQGNVRHDRVYDELQRKIGKASVEPGWVIVTGPGELRRNKVRAIFHVAAQHGEPCHGYNTIRSYVNVVSNALEKMSEFNESRWLRWRQFGDTRPLRSIVFPLLGTRSRSRDPIDVTVSLVREARKYLTLWPNQGIQAVYFLAYTQRDLELCEAAFDRLGMPLPRPAKATA